VHESNVEIVLREHWPGRFARGLPSPSAWATVAGYSSSCRWSLKEPGCLLKKAPQGDRVRPSRRKRRDTIKTP